MTVEDDTTEAPVVYQVASIDRDELEAETLGLTLADGQAILRELQAAVTARQVATWQAQQRLCPVCGQRRPLKAINQVVGKRFSKSQSMRWTRKGAHLFLQTRTCVLNEELDDIFRGRYPGFRAPCAVAIAQPPQEALQ